MGRSRAVKPTLAQKKLMTEAGLIVKNWLVLREDAEELRLVSRASGKSRSIKKPPRRQAEGAEKNISSRLYHGRGGKESEFS